MSSGGIEGKVKNGIGQAEAAAGEVLGDPGMQVRGEARQIEGAAEDAIGRAKETIGKTAKIAREAVAARPIRPQTPIRRCASGPRAWRRRSIRSSRSSPTSR